MLVQGFLGLCSLKISGKKKKTRKEKNLLFHFLTDKKRDWVARLDVSLLLNP